MKSMIVKVSDEIINAYCDDEVNPRTLERFCKAIIHAAFAYSNNQEFLREHKIFNASVECSQDDSGFRLSVYVMYNQDRYEVFCAVKENGEEMPWNVIKFIHNNYTQEVFRVLAEEGEKLLQIFEPYNAPANSGEPDSAVYSNQKNTSHSARQNPDFSREACLFNEAYEALNKEESQQNSDFAGGAYLFDEAYEALDK